MLPDPATAYLGETLVVARHERRRCCKQRKTENDESMPGIRQLGYWRVGWLGVMALIAASSARADYYQCTDHAGTTYKVRQQIGEKYDGFFSSCELVAEAPVKEEGNAETTRNEWGALSDPSPSSMTIVMPPATTRVAKRRARNVRAAEPDSVTEKLIRSVADEYQLDPHLLKAIVHVESGFDAKAVSPKGALGLMQVMPATGARYGVKAPDILISNPAENLRAGARYLRDLSKLFENRLDLVLAAYNAGEGSVIRNQYRIPEFPETEAYVVSVQAAYKTYRMQSNLD